MRIRQLMTPGFVLIAVGLVPAALLVADARTQSPRAPVYAVEVVAEYPHDSTAFSQGLVARGDRLLEGTGQYGESTLREVDLKTGKVLRQVKLPDSVFGEGITEFEGKIYQLTWKRGLAYVYDSKTLKYEKTLRYSGEGWGLTHDGRHLIMSDGTATLKFLNPETFRVVKTLKVRDGRFTIRELNELEFVNGEIWANVWHRDYIARIDPATGRVRSWLDLRKQRPSSVRNLEEAVLNGIAVEPTSGRLFVTGKDWPVLYEIRVATVPQSR